MPRSAAQRPVPLFAKYIRAPTVGPAIQRQLDSAPFYLAVQSGIIAAAGAELNRRLRNAGIPKVLAKGLDRPTLFAPRRETLRQYQY